MVWGKELWGHPVLRVGDQADLMPSFASLLLHGLEWPSARRYSSNKGGMRKMFQLQAVSIGAGLAIGTMGSALIGYGLGGASHHELVRGLTPEQAEILSHMSIVYLDDGQGGQSKTIRMTGVNVQVVNGAGATETTNGLGNLVVGYQELGNEVADDIRTGSHYIVTGRRNSYTGFGGFLGGESNTSSGAYGSVTGGRRNEASGPWSSVNGGGHNRAGATNSVVCGGSFNYSGSDSTVVVGGEGNQALPAGGGGAGNKAVVVGGYDNRSMGQGSVVVGGRYNETTANYSAMLAGASNSCVGDPQGGGSYCAIVGGEGNSTSNVTAATISGGQARSASGPHDWVAGSLFEDD